MQTAAYPMIANEPVMQWNYHSYGQDPLALAMPAGILQGKPIGIAKIKTELDQINSTAKVSWDALPDMPPLNISPLPASDGKSLQSSSFTMPACGAHLSDDSLPSTSTRTPTGTPATHAPASNILNVSSGDQRGVEDCRVGTGGLNKSRYRGVSYDKKKRKWRVQIKVATLGKSGVSVGYYDTEEAAARAYDRAAIGLLGRDNCSITTNFPLSDYDRESVPQLIGKSREEVKATLKSERAKVPRRRFTSRQRTSKYMGVGSSNRKNQWQARILVHGKVTHLGYYETEEEAARVYDRVSISLHGAAAQTNFDICDYADDDMTEFAGLEREELQRALGVKPMDKSSKFRGVSKKKGKWEAKVMVNRKWAYRELFDSEEEAARAYDAAVWRLKPKEAKSYVNFKPDKAEGPGAGDKAKVAAPNTPNPKAPTPSSLEAGPQTLAGSSGGSSSSGGTPPPACGKQQGTKPSSPKGSAHAAHGTHHKGSLAPSTRIEKKASLSRRHSSGQLSMALGALQEADDLLHSHKVGRHSLHGHGGDLGGFDGVGGMLEGIPMSAPSTNMMAGVPTSSTYNGVFQGQITRMQRVQSDNCISHPPGSAPATPPRHLQLSDLPPHFALSPGSWVANTGLEGAAMMGANSQPLMVRVGSETHMMPSSQVQSSGFGALSRVTSEPYMSNTLGYMQRPVGDNMCSTPELASAMMDHTSMQLDALPGQSSSYPSPVVQLSQGLVSSPHGVAAFFSSALSAPQPGQGAVEWTSPMSAGHTAHDFPMAGYAPVTTGMTGMAEGGINRSSSANSLHSNGVPPVSWAPSAAVSGGMPRSASVSHIPMLGGKEGLAGTYSREMTHLRTLQEDSELQEPSSRQSDLLADLQTSQLDMDCQSPLKMVQIGGEELHMFDAEDDSSGFLLDTDLEETQKDGL